MMPCEDEPGAERGDERGHPRCTVMNPLTKPTARPMSSAEQDRQDRRDAVEVDQVVHEER